MANPSVPRVLPDPLSLPWSDDWARFGDATSMPAVPFLPLSGVTMSDSTAAGRPVPPSQRLTARPAAAVRPVAPPAPARPQVAPRQTAPPRQGVRPGQVAAPRPIAPPARVAAPHQVAWAPAPPTQAPPPTFVRRPQKSRRALRFIITLGIAALVIYLRVHGSAR